MGIPEGEEREMKREKNTRAENFTKLNFKIPQITTLEKLNNPKNDKCKESHTQPQYDQNSKSQRQTILIAKGDK